MKTNDIITAIGLPVTKTRREHAATLSEIYKHLTSIKQDVLSVDVEVKEFIYAQKIELRSIGWKQGYEKYVVSQGDKMAGERWTLKTKTGSYTVSLPTGNTVYNMFAALFPTFISPVTAVVAKPDNAIVLGSEVVKEIKKAMNFIKIDKLGTWVNCVCIRVKDGIAYIIATDRYVVYKSLPIAIDYKDGDILLNVSDLKQALSVDKKSLFIEVFADKILLNGVNTAIPDFEAPNYDNVIPDYKKSIEVNRKKLIEAVTLISFAANKYTKQVNLHINGAIQISSEDMDWNNESETVVKYERKEMQDFDISVNANYLLNALKVLDSAMVNIYSDGESNKCLRLGNKSEVAKVLIMPIVMTN